MKNTCENADGVFNPRPHSGSAVLNCNGVFYARVSLDGSEPPLIIALHGIRSESEAEEALRSFVRRDHPPVAAAPPRPPEFHPA